MSRPLFTVRQMAALAFLTSLEIVLSRFLSLSAWNMKIGFSFIPVAIAAILYGAIPAGIVAALGDFLGALLFPIGPYFPGFTLTAFLTGLVLGLFLHREQTSRRILLAVGINQILWSLLLNTLWIHILYGSPFLPLLWTRCFQCAVLLPVQFVCIEAIVRLLIPQLRSIVT